MWYADGDGADGDRLVFFHHVHEGAFGPALDGCGRDERHPSLHLQQKPGIDELIGKQGAVLVREDGLEPHGACIGIDLIVDRQERAGRKLVFLFTVEGVHG